MRNFTIVVVAIMSLFTTRSMAQSTAKVSGSITDNNNKGLSAVTVSLLQSKDSSLAKAAMTDASGKFEFSVAKNGSYLLGYSLVGFESKFSPVFEIKDGQGYD